MTPTETNPAPIAGLILIAGVILFGILSIAISFLNNKK
jgi:hypothetical protein